MPEATAGVILHATTEALQAPSVSILPVSEYHYLRKLLACFASCGFQSNVESGHGASRAQPGTPTTIFRPRPSPSRTQFVENATADAFVSRLRMLGGGQGQPKRH